MRAAGVHRTLNPMNLSEIDAVFVLQQPVDVDGCGHGQQRHPDALALEILWGLDACLAVDGDEAVAKRARWKYRNRHERTLLVGETLDELGARKLGDVEILTGRHPMEDRLHSVIKPARERKLQLGHLLFFPNPLERNNSLSTRARRPKTPLAVSRSGGMTRTAGNDAA